MLNCPSPWISPIMTGLAMWWFGSIVTSKPDGDLNFWPIIASRTASTSAVPACSTACAHVEQDVGRFHRIVGDIVGLLRIGAPFGDEGLVLRRVDRLEVAPRREVADERL